MVGRTLWSAQDALVPLCAPRIRHLCHCGRPTGLAADQGVRPTNLCRIAMPYELGDIALASLPHTDAGPMPFLVAAQLLYATGYN
jgi:hypothetical protein